MFLAPLILALSEKPDNSGYLYVQGTCVAQNDGTDPIFWGLSRGECEDVAEADRSLNRAYRRTMVRLRNAQKIQLRTEQRRWITSTNTVCDLSDGTAMRSTAADCFIRAAGERTIVLRHWGL